MRLALDEDVSHPLARLLRGNGVEANSAKELRRLGLSDVQVLLTATDAGEVVITHNGDDFELLHEAWVTWKRRWAHEFARATNLRPSLSRHGGILILPHLDAPTLVRILGALVASPDALDDRALVWSVTRGWYELLP